MGRPFKKPSDDTVKSSRENQVKKRRTVDIGDEHSHPHKFVDSNDEIGKSNSLSLFGIMVPG